MPPPVKLSPVVAKLKGAMPKKRTEPLWKGPCAEGPMGGVTQSLLGRFLVCPERFRLNVVEGLRPPDGFNHNIEYGNMWHLCEEFHAQGQAWEGFLKKYAQELCKRYRFQQKQVVEYYEGCKAIFPVYVKFWEKHPDVRARTPIYQEAVFDVPYKLPSGRVIRLRGKWDSVDVIKEANVAGIYIQENKTKSEVNEQLIRRQLGFDLQSMIYLVALRLHLEQLKQDKYPKALGGGARHPGKPIPIAGVRYNVIKRPFSGGKGSIRPHKEKRTKTKHTPAETPANFYKRLAAVYAATPKDFFARWKVRVTSADLEVFEERFLKPTLERLCDWYEHVTNYMKGRAILFGPHMSADGAPTYLHWQHPFGVYNVMNEGGSSEYDEHLATGSMVGLRRVDSMFNELK